MELSQAIAEAVNVCIQNNIMGEFLQKHGSEVENMLFTEWSWEKALEVRDEEAEARGMEKGIEKGIEKEKRSSILAIADLCPPEEIVRRFKVSLDFVKPVLSGEKQAQGN